MHSTLLREKMWKIWLIVGGAAVVIYFTVARAIPHATEIDYFAIGAGAVAAILIGIRLQRPARSLPWYLLAAGMALWATGDGIFNGALFLGINLPYPSVSDLFFITAYPVLGVGLLLSKGRRRRGGSRAVETAIITLSATLASWVLLMRPYLDDPTAPLLARVVSISYPICDLILLGVMIPMLGSTRRRTESSRLLMTWLTLLLVTDAIYSAMVIHGSYIDGAWIDGGWLIGYVLLGAAALHPSMASGVEEDGEYVGRHTIGRVTLALLAVASLAGPSLIVVEATNHDWSAAATTACGCVILAMLVLVRLTGLVRESDARRTELDQTLEQLSFQALHDHLTGLANRVLFADRIEHASARFTRSTSTFAVLVLDLDEFKAVNDAMGHTVGDALLAEVSRRLTATARTADTVARLGGDEFAILLEDLDNEVEALSVAKRVVTAIKTPLVLGGRTVTPSVSVGVAMHDPSCDSSETLRHADLAMYSAKQAGKGRAAVYSSDMGETESLSIELEADLLRAVDSAPSQFVVYYQPIVALSTGRVEAVEALVRWNHPWRGLLAPADFLPIAEHTGLIVPIGRLVLREACRQVAIWRKSIAGMESLGVSVNLSTKQVESADLLLDVTVALAHSNLQPDALTLELTEHLLVGESDAIDDVLRGLSTCGVRLSIDDFGTGSASLSYIRRFPISELKIDRSYIDGLGAAGEAPQLVQGLVDLGRAVGLRIVAEGIEHGPEVRSLLEMDCQSGQGFYFGRPTSAEESESILAGWFERGKIMYGALQA